MSEEDLEQAYREAYPEQLDASEQELIRLSRKARGKPTEVRTRECTGIGLSGGGIRSATFCLGVFQGLATLKFLKQIDIVSTVSGGGYFGSFYTRFFLRKEVPDFNFVEETLTPCPGSGDRSANTPYQRNIINWLRENGRYLSPTGSGDMLLAGAVFVRNWIVVQIVLATFFLLLFLTAQLLRIPVDPAFRMLGFFKEPGVELVKSLPGGIKLWLTPFVTLPILLFFFWAVPLGWAYWMVGRQPPQTRFWKHPMVGLGFMVVMALLALFKLPRDDAGFQIALSVLIIAALTLVCCFLSWWVYSRRSTEAEDPSTGSKYRAAFKDDLTRQWVSAYLKTALVTALAVLGFVVIDSLGQTVYLVLLTPGTSLRNWAGGLLGSIIALVPFANRIMLTLRGADGGKRPAIFTKIAAGVAAFVVVVTLLTTFSVGANAIAWALKRPVNAPADIGSKPAVTLLKAAIVPDKDQPNNWSVRSEEAPADGETAATRNDVALWCAWGITFILSFLFGQTWPFLNRSTQLPLYSARLTRAYLGASNPRRFSPDAAGQAGGAITRVIPGDDIDIEYYWPWLALKDDSSPELEKAKQGIYLKGTPLHLVNVTINETLDSKSQVQQQDRKGMGMAFGPAGISAGVKHHVVFDRTTQKTETFPKQGFRMFRYGETGVVQYTGERLPLGQLLSISGAAFSTGLGARTNLALSLLAGIGNIRLGYWWNSDVVPEKRPRQQKLPISQRLGSIFTYLFPVQSYLLDEYTARYHGPARKEWYLSDGGHFENMGGYELIRRRLRLIVIVDAEADPDYNFGGLAGLIRKARIDFGADIEFLEDEELNRLMPGDKHCFSSLQNLRRGKWVEESLPLLDKTEAKKRQVIDPINYLRYSLAHAALARVTYGCDEKAQSCLVYIKPTIMGNEPLDVLQYHVENPTFPQQTTMDQFFDEAQWESYRTLGEHIARKVFRAPDGEDHGSWWETLIEKVLQTPEPDRAVKSSTAVKSP